MKGSRAASLVVAVMLAAPGVAVAAPPANPFAPLPATPQQTPTQAPPTVIQTSSNPASSPGGGLSSGAAVAIGVGALAILLGIAGFIWYDARRRAPVRRRTAEATAGGSSPGSKRAPKSRKLSPAERKRRKRGRAR